MRTKLTRVSPTTLIVTAGDTDRGLVLREWVRNGMKPEEWPAFQQTKDWVVLIVLVDGKIFEYNQEPIGIPLESPYFAWGSGQQFAMGAMAMGATATQAVDVASKHCNTCGLGVDSYTTQQEAV